MTRCLFRLRQDRLPKKGWASPFNGMFSRLNTQAYVPTLFFGLMRLTTSQSTVLSTALLSRAADFSLRVQARTDAMKQYTLCPTTTHLNMQSLLRPTKDDMIDDAMEQKDVVKSFEASRIPGLKSVFHGASSAKVMEESLQGEPSLQNVKAALARIFFLSSKDLRLFDAGEELTDENGVVDLEKQFWVTQWPVEVEAAILRGMIVGSDEVLPPFRYLFHPDTLAWCDQPTATSAVLSVANVLGPSHVGSAAKALLSSSTHMSSFKVTTTKTLMRLLGDGDDGALMFLFKQWKKQLHRDVRIVVIQMALQLLAQSRSPALTDEEARETGVYDVLADAAENYHLDAAVRCVLLNTSQPVLEDGFKIHKRLMIADRATTLNTLLSKNFFLQDLLSNCKKFLI